MLDPFDANDKIIDLVHSGADRQAGRITFAYNFVAAEAPDWYIVSVTLTGLPAGRKPRYDVFLYIGEEAYYDVTRNMTVSPRDYFIAEARDGHEADAVLVDKAMQYSAIDDIFKFHKRNQ